MKKLSALLLMITVLMTVCVPVSAAGLTYTSSSGYASSRYYSNIRELSLTQNQRLDLVNAALSQVGYHEGDSVSQLDGSNSAGSHNYTEYGYWFGTSILGHSDGFFYDWCAMFVAWCARQARISTDVINNATYARIGANPYHFHMTYRERGTYTPKPGDLIFYDWYGNDRNWDHVGIVTFVANGRVHTVEGNASDMVLTRDFSLYDSQIQGYGVPSYTGADVSAFSVSNYPKPTRNLSLGATGSDVKWLQAALYNLGYASPIDGKFGQNTLRQLKKFQSDRGILVDGVCGPGVLSSLTNALSSGPANSSEPSNYPVPTRTLRVGMTGEDVKWLQAVLKKLGAVISIDGDFGSATKLKVIWAQRTFGLTPDGVVGPATRDRLIQALESQSGGSTSPNSYPVPTRTLRKGMSGDDVRWLQCVLRSFGLSANPTGWFGDVTRENVMSFQRSRGLSPDGVVGPATRAKLLEFLDSSGFPEPTRVLKTGMRGDDVKWVQFMLNRLSYGLTVDGIFGSCTRNAVISFQRSEGLYPDGMVGPATVLALKNRH